MNYKYYGWSKYHNFGDDVLEEIAIKKGFKLDDTSKNLLIGGGTILPLHPQQLLYKMKLEGFKPEKIVVYGAGVSSPAPSNELEFTQKFLKKCKHIGLRDEASQSILGMGCVIGDPFFHIDYKKVPIEERSHYVAVNVGYDAGNCLGGMDAQLDYIKHLLKFIKVVLIDRYQYKIAPLLLHNIDTPFVQLLINYLGPENIILPKNKSKIIEVFANAELAITYKQHGLITALCVGTPVIPIAYHTKVINVANEFGLNVLRTDEVNFNKLLIEFKNIRNFPYERIEKKIDEYKKNAKIFLDEVMKK